MSSVVRLGAPMVDAECLVAALQHEAVGCTAVHHNGNQIRATHSQGGLTFETGKLGYQLTARDGQRRQFTDLVRTINDRYEIELQAKLDRLAEEERQRVEAEKARIRAEQEQRLVEKARAMGYRLDKRVEADKTVRLVLVRRSF